MAMKDVVHNIRDAVEAPLTQPLNAEHMFLLTGIVIVAAGFWFMVLAHLRQILRTD